MVEQTINRRFESHLIDNREVRIFLSSTFADMDSERSALVKLFNKLKLEANRRNVSLSLLDLRWGVTDEESRTGKVLSVCLNEIENSHPFFIGLLGSRYGYSPKASELEKNPDLKERYPWLPQDIAQGLSITEIEMQYGVLRNQEGVDAAFFIKNTPDTLPDDDSKLSTLKKEILDQKRFPVTDYTSIDNLCDKVEQLVMDLLDKYFSDADNTRLGRERNIQRAYMNSRHKYYVRRQEDFDRLNDFLINNERYLVVTGPSGIGKSALIANWLKDQETKKDLPCNIIYHFVGNTFGGNNYESILQHLSDELFDLYEGIEVRLGNNESPEQKAQRYMTEAAQKGRPMLIVIDGINQISEQNNGKLLTWLPQSQRNVKYLFSTLEDDATMDVFRRLEYPVYRVGSLTNNQRQQFISDYLLLVGKKLNVNQINRILDSSIVENTLVLKTLLDELICFGSYEHLDERINRYLSTTTVSDFFERMLQRMEEDYEAVRRLMSLLAVSEHGLSEDELLAITGIRQLDFHLFYCAASQLLVMRNDLLTFAHQYVSDAVWDRYRLSELQSARDCREDIIRYFSSTKSVINNRRISELAFQYYHMDDGEHLYQTIMSFEAFNLYNASDECEVQLAIYWRKLREINSEKYRLRNYLDLPYDGINLEDLPYLKIGSFVSYYFADYQTSMMYNQTYLMMAQFSGKDDSVYVAASYDNIGNVYADLGDYDNALEYMSKALTVRETILGPEHPDTAKSFNNVGLVYKKLGVYNKTIESYFKAVSINEKVLGVEHLETATIYHNIGLFYSDFGEYDNALKYLFKALSINEKVLGIEHPNVSLCYGSIGVVYANLGDYGMTQKYFSKALSIREKVWGPEHPNTACLYNDIGVVYKRLGDYDNALEFLLKALTIREKVLGPEHPNTATSYNNIGLVYECLGNYNKALEYFFKSLVIEENVLGSEHPDTAISYNNIGGVYDNQGDHDKALEFLLKALTIREKVLGSEHPDTAMSYNNIGSVYECLGNYDKALEYFFKSLSIKEKVLGSEHPDTAISYNNIGGVYDKLGEYDEALKYLFKALSVMEFIWGFEHPNTASLYDNIGGVYHELGDYNLALDYYSKALVIREKALGLDHPNTATSYNNIGLVYECLGNYDKALEYFFKSLVIEENVLGYEHPDTAISYNNIGLVYYKQGDHDKALEFLLKALTIREKVLGSEHPDTATSYDNVGSIYADLGEYDNALESLLEALTIREKVFGSIHPKIAMSYNNIGTVYHELGDYDLALDYFFKALAIREKIYGIEHPDTADSYNNIGFVYYYQGEYAKALEYFDKVYHIRLLLLGDSHPMTKEIKDNIETTKTKQAIYMNK